MNRHDLHLALRELRGVYTDPRALAAMGAVGIIAGLAGPFDTFVQLPLAMRIIYWLLIAFSTYGIGLLGAVLFASAVKLDERAPLPVRVCVMAAGASPLVTLAVLTINWVFLPHSQRVAFWPLWLLLYIFLITLALMALLKGVIEPHFSGREGSQDESRPPPLLERLPHDIRGPLSHLSMADHYVEVTTQNGSALVLMRLADAIAETGNIDGLQVHRSHWVAAKAVSSFARRGGKPVLIMRNGAQIPVSRSYLEIVRARFSSNASMMRDAV